MTYIIFKKIIVMPQLDLVIYFHEYSFLFFSFFLFYFVFLKYYLPILVYWVKLNNKYLLYNLVYLNKLNSSIVSKSFISNITLIVSFVFSINAVSKLADVQLNNLEKKLNVSKLELIQYDFDKKL